MGPKLTGLAAAGAVELLCCGQAVAQDGAATLMSAAPSSLTQMPARMSDVLAPRQPSAIEELTGAIWEGSAVRSLNGADISVFVSHPHQFDGPGGALPSDAFGLSNRRTAGAFGERAVQLNVEARAFDTSAGDLDFEIGPRAGVASGFGERSVGAGVIARLGQNLGGRGSGQKAWYLFAGAGARAVELDPTQRGLGISEAQVRDKAIVGDMQAGLAFDMGPADLSLAYSRRERPIEWAKDQHDGFAVLSLSFRH